MKKTWISSAHRGFVTAHMHSNTLSAFMLAARKGADMIETDARTTADGVIVANHDPNVKGFDNSGNPVEYEIGKNESSLITHVVLAPRDPQGIQTVPTLKQVLHLCYVTGMQINIDLKEGAAHAEEIAYLVRVYGMRGRAVYATNGAGTDCIKAILKIDPEARFIDKPANYTSAKLASISDYPARCYAYTGNFAEETIRSIRESGCMLATISLNGENAAEAFKWHPEMAEYPHTSDFEAIDTRMMSELCHGVL